MSVPGSCSDDACERDEQEQAEGGQTVNDVLFAGALFLADSLFDQLHTVAVSYIF